MFTKVRVKNGSSSVKPLNSDLLDVTSNTSNKQFRTAARIYRMMAKRQPIFLQRNLRFRKHFSKKSTASRLASVNGKAKCKKRRLSQLFTVGQSSPKRQKFDESVFEKSLSPKQNKLSSDVEIVIESVENDSHNYDEVEIEVVVMKFNGAMLKQRQPDDCLLRDIGRFKIPGNQSITKSSNYDSNLPVAVKLPPDAFSPLNGHRSWSSWLIIRCNFISSKSNERSLRRINHRQSSEWKNSPDVMRTACLPICFNGDRQLLDGKTELKFWKLGKNNDQLMDIFHDLFLPSYKTISSSKHNFKLECESASCLNIDVHFINQNGGCESSPSTSSMKFADLMNLVNLRPSKKSPKKTSKKSESQVPKALYYRFIFSGEKGNDSYHLSTLADESSRCPFCTVWTEDVYFLMKHLCLVHQRFTFFQKVNLDNDNIIEVRLNNSYDPSMELNRCTTRTRISKRKRRPLKTTFAPLLRWRKIKTNKMLDEEAFRRSLDLFESTLFDSPRNVPRHKRQYYHSQTCMKLSEKGFDYDSESEIAPDWLCDTRKKLIDEYCDVNEGEKTIMKFWNECVMKNNLFGDGEMFSSCQLFWKKYGCELSVSHFVKNYKLHLANLFQFGFLTQHQMSNLLGRIRETKCLADQKKCNKTT